jgi:hypothetical protein
MGYLPFAALAAIHLGGPQGDTARLTVEDSRVDGTESGVPQPDPATNAFRPIRHLRPSFFKEVRTPLQPPIRSLAGGELCTVCHP